MIKREGEANMGGRQALVGFLELQLMNQTSPFGLTGFDRAVFWPASCQPNSLAGGSLPLPGAVKFGDRLMPDACYISPRNHATHIFI
jgi:hypothetical protein